MTQFRDYLKDEDERNVRNHRIFERFLRKAIPDVKMVMVAHHITYLPEGGAPVEIPSADTLIFCPELMGAVFGNQATNIMLVLCARPPSQRDQALNSFLDTLEIEEAELASQGDSVTNVV